MCSKFWQIVVKKEMKLSTRDSTIANARRLLGSSKIKIARDKREFSPVAAVSHLITYVGVGREKSREKEEYN